MRAQYQAATSFFRNEGNWYKKIKSIQAPTLVANGDRDPTFPAIDSVVLAHAIPKCRLALYPDAGHGFPFQYPHRFAADLGTFLRPCRWVLEIGRASCRERGGRYVEV